MLVETFDDYQLLTWHLHTEDMIAIDTETNGLHPYHGSHMIGMSFYFPANNQTFYIPFRHEAGINAPDEYLQDLKNHYPLPGKTYIGHNLKFDLHVLHVEGFNRPDRVEETMIAAHLINENEWLSNGEQVKGAYSLKRLARKYLGDWAGEGEDELIAAAKAAGIDAKGQMALLPPEMVSKYAEMDTEITWHLREYYRPLLEAWDQWELYQIQSEYMLKFLFEAEKNGMYINEQTINSHVLAIQEELPALREELVEEARLSGNSAFNPGSPSQVLAFLTARGYKLESTGADILEPLSRAGDVWPKKILRYRKLSKLETSFYEPYLKVRDPNGFVHTSYLVTGTTTGRLASIEPNLQQVPKKGEIKEIFEARPGYVYVVMDYSQLELRLAIHFSGERTMRRMFEQGIDLHQYTATELTAMLKYDIDRDLGKRANFGLLYRMGGMKAALKFGIDVKLAVKLVEGWRKLYPEFGQAYTAFMKKAQQWRDESGDNEGPYQFIRLEDGRVKHFHEFGDYTYLDEASNTEKPRDDSYKAWNFIIQGTGASITRSTALNVSRMFDGIDDVLPVLTVHDSLGWEVKEDFVQMFVAVMSQLATDYPQYAVPLKIDVQVGRTWGDMVSYKEWMENA